MAELKPLNHTGSVRLETERLILRPTSISDAEQIENVHADKHVMYVLDNYKDKHVAFCYDTGHANLWSRGTDWLSMYADRLAAIHLHDNNGNEDEHTFPLTGTIDWIAVMEKINKSLYDGCLALETEYKGNENTEQLESFLKTSYQSGLDLALL